MSDISASGAKTEKRLLSLKVEGLTLRGFDELKSEDDVYFLRFECRAALFKARTHRCPVLQGLITWKDTFECKIPDKSVLKMHLMQVKQTGDAKAALLIGETEVNVHILHGINSSSTKSWHAFRHPPGTVSNKLEVNLSMTLKDDSMTNEIIQSASPPEEAKPEPPPSSPPHSDDASDHSDSSGSKRSRRGGNSKAAFNAASKSLGKGIAEARKEEQRLAKIVKKLTVELEKSSKDLAVARQSAAAARALQDQVAKLKATMAGRLPAPDPVPPKSPAAAATRRPIAVAQPLQELYDFVEPGSHWSKVDRCKRLLLDDAASRSRSRVGRSGGGGIDANGGPRREWTPGRPASKAAQHRPVSAGRE